MSGFSMWHWLVVIIWLSSVIPAAMILGRLGFSRWLAILFLIPLAWIIGVWILAVSRWPIEDHARAFE